MSGRYLFLLAAIGCSSPSVATKRDIAAPAGQGSAGAAGVTRPYLRNSATSSPSELPDPSEPPEPQEPIPPLPPSTQQQTQRQPYVFDWERVRKNWEKIKATPYSQLPCDPHTGAPTRKGVYCTPGVEPKMAAKVISKKSLDLDRTELWIDVGAEDQISKKWYAALIDEQGHPIMEWVHLEGVRKWDSLMIAPFNHYEINKETARVALVEELPK